MTKKTIYEKMMEEKEFERLMAQEDLILEVTETFMDILAVEKVKKNALAQMMGKTKGFISQILNGSRNLTLRTLADMAFTLGYAIELRFVKKTKREQKDTINLAWEFGQKGDFSLGKLTAPDEYGPPSCDFSGAKVAA